MNFRLPTLLFLLHFIMAGCGGGSKPLINLYGSLENRSFCRMAVLPFLNESSFLNGEIIVYRVFTSELVNADSFFLSQEGDVRNLYQQLEIYPGTSPDFEQLRIIGDRLNVDILIEGKIVDMSDGTAARKSYPLLGLSLKVIDAKTGTTLWTTFHRKKGQQYRKMMHFGLVNTINALTQKISQEILISWFKEGFKKCSQS